MITNRQQDIVHKVHLLRVLTEIIDNPILSQSLYFKGGTCASMMNILDRFSVDLDFDISPKSDEKILRDEFHKIFRKLDPLYVAALPRHLEGKCENLGFRIE